MFMIKIFCLYYMLPLSANFVYLLDIILTSLPTNIVQII